ncbi:unnamed protein product, partial [Dicrocoelium dendriticum]
MRNFPDAFCDSETCLWNIASISVLANQGRLNSFSSSRWTPRRICLQYPEAEKLYRSHRARINPNASFAAAHTQGAKRIVQHGAEP